VRLGACVRAEHVQTEATQLKLIRDKEFGARAYGLIELLHREEPGRTPKHYDPVGGAAKSGKRFSIFTMTSV
jgi:hypothetical protein